jgi:hypothetical protein
VWIGRVLPGAEGLAPAETARCILPAPERLAVAETASSRDGRQKQAAAHDGKSRPSHLHSLQREK